MTSSKPSIILCVDDEELPLKLRREVLSRQGYRVLSAHNGESGLQMFRDNKVDLVISDNRRVAHPSVFCLQLRQKKYQWLMLTRS